MQDYQRYLDYIGFDKYVGKIAKKLKNKHVIIYGCGELLQYAFDKQKLKDIKVVAISDYRFGDNDIGKTIYNHKVIKKSDIEDYNPDCILIGTKKYFDIAVEFERKFRKKKKVKVIPLFKMHFKDLVRQIWYS